MWTDRNGMSFTTPQNFAAPDILAHDNLSRQHFTVCVANTTMTAIPRWTAQATIKCMYAMVAGIWYAPREPRLCGRLYHIPPMLDSSRQGRVLHPIARPDAPCTVSVPFFALPLPLSALCNGHPPLWGPALFPVNEGPFPKAVWSDHQWLLFSVFVVV